MGESPKLVRATAADAVYKELRKDIINLHFKPGEKLSEAKLAEYYGVSRDPVRKSISRLIQEGLVESRPQYGTIVTEVSIEQGIAVCDIRLLLETYAIRKAVNNIDEETLDSLVNDLDDIEKRMEFQDDEAIKQDIYSLDGRMHKAIYASSGNAMIAEIISSYEYIISRIQISNMVWHSRKQQTMKEMHEIIYALKDRNEDRAVAAMSVHIENIRKTVEKPTDKKGVQK